MNLLTDPSLPDAGVLDALRNSGHTRLEAIHRIADKVARHVWKVLWMGRVKSGEAKGAEIPEELRNAAPPTNEDLDASIRALAGKREHPHRPRTRPAKRGRR